MTTATTTPVAAAGRLRPRRSCLAVPGSSPRFLEKAQGLPGDQVFLDLEDACAPLVKESARHAIVDALNNGDWGGKIRVVRVNDWTTQWTYRDVITVVEGAGANLDCLMLPKVAGAGQVVALDLLLTQIEKTTGWPAGRIGIEAQIENAQGLMNVEAIAAASPRLQTIIFGPADFMASVNMRSQDADYSRNSRPPASRLQPARDGPPGPRDATTRASPQGPAGRPSGPRGPWTALAQGWPRRERGTPRRGRPAIAGGAPVRAGAI
jgi:HpcH/HpaI aldolase/citrate lyase family